MSTPSVGSPNRSRREFVVGLTGGLAALGRPSLLEGAIKGGRLKARPGPAMDSLAPGLAPLGLASRRDGVVFVPEGRRTGEPTPLVVLFHGASGSGQRIAERLQPIAQELGLALLAPDSRESSWDIRYGSFGDDVEFIDLALDHVFARLTTDADRVAAAGFSDGASYVLSLGLTNGDLFRRLIAFSPGFMAPEKRVGRPPIFVSHGTRDPILSIDVTSRRLVPQLVALGYRVDYREFEGGHQMKEDLTRAALQAVKD